MTYLMFYSKTILFLLPQSSYGIILKLRYHSNLKTSLSSQNIWFNFTIDSLGLYEFYLILWYSSLSLMNHLKILSMLILQQLVNICLIKICSSLSVFWSQFFFYRMKSKISFCCSLRIFGFISFGKRKYRLIDSFSKCCLFIQKKIPL